VNLVFFYHEIQYFSVITEQHSGNTGGTFQCTMQLTTARFRHQSTSDT